MRKFEVYYDDKDTTCQRFPSSSTSYRIGGAGGHHHAHESHHHHHDDVDHDHVAASTSRSVKSARKSQSSHAAAAGSEHMGHFHKHTTEIFDEKCEEFENIKRRHNKQKLYEDKDFPATAATVNPSQPNARVEWKRPHEITDHPTLISSGADRFDVKQGELGDCWVLAAVASLSMFPTLFHKVVPMDQEFGADYCGAFHFRFWRFGEWKDVIVDDRLPVRGKQLIFMHSVDKTEFWSALIEKAYAKLHGSYEALVGGAQGEAMEDFTGGMVETEDISADRVPVNFFQRLQRAINRSSLIGCSIDAEDDQIEDTLPNGLIVGHAYSLSDVKEVNYRGHPTKLVRVRNPWGDSSEWNGAWSDNSNEWKAFSENERKQMGITFDDDGEFWMPYQEFINNFTKVEICHLGPDTLHEEENLSNKKIKIRWEVTSHHGEWQKNVSAGGCRNFLTSFINNPQYNIEVTDPDETDADNTGTIIVGLMQKDMRAVDMDFWTIGYTIYALPTTQTGPLNQKFFRVNKMAAKSPKFVNSREVCGRHKLKPGRYVIIPSTFNPNESAKFLLRIFSAKPYQSNELDSPNTMHEVVPTKPKNEDDISKLKEAFDSMAGPRHCINACNLRDILNSTLKKQVRNFNGFSTESCRSMLALFDSENPNGKMEFDEFTELWLQLCLWRKVFDEEDADKSGSFDSFELRKALNASGYKVSNAVFQAVANRYTDPEKGTILFEDFILLQTRMRRAFQLYSKHSNSNRLSKASFDEDEFLSLTLYT